MDEGKAFASSLCSSAPQLPINSPTNGKVLPRPSKAGEALAPVTSRTEASVSCRQLRVNRRRDRAMQPQPSRRIAVTPSRFTPVRNHVAKSSIALNANPARIKETIATRPFTLAIAYTEMTVAMEQTNAVVAVAPKPNNASPGTLKESAAPSAASPEDPITYGSAIGFLKSPWYSNPPIDSAAPMTAAQRALGSRMSNRIVFSA